MAVRDVDAIEALFPVTLLAIVFVAVCVLIVSDIIDHRYNLEKEAMTAVKMQIIADCNDPQKVELLRKYIEARVHRVYNENTSSGR